MFLTATLSFHKFTVAPRLRPNAQMAAPLGVWFSLLCLSTRLTAGETNEWWAVKPLVEPAIPRLSSKSSGSKSPRNPIDSFVRSGLEKNGLQPAPEADRRVLIRR